MFKNSFPTWIRYNHKLQTRAFDHFWALLLIANEVESSRSLLVSILKAESLLLSLIDVEVIY